MKILTFFFLFLFANSYSQSIYKIFEELRTLHYKTSFFCDVETKKLNDSLINELNNNLKIPVNSKEAIRVSNTILKNINSNFQINLASDTEWIQIAQVKGKQFYSIKNEIFTSRGVYSGIEYSNKSYVYLKIEDNHPMSVNAIYNSSNTIVSIGIELPFIVEENTSEFTAIQFEKIMEAIQKLNRRLQIIEDILIDNKNQIYKVRNDNKQFTSAERLYGFIQFWTEVKYNFAFFNQVPNLDWDKTLQDYLPLIEKEQNNYEYYKLLKKVCALLKDGHTDIYLPSSIQLWYPPIELINLDGKVFAIKNDFDDKALVPIGSEILKVNDIDVKLYLEEKIIPYISSSTKHILYNNATKYLLEGELDNDVVLTIKKPDGSINAITIKREYNSFNWNRTRMSNFEFKKLENNIGYISLNSFSDESIIEEFNNAIPAIEKSDKIIIDLRNNTGGNSSIGYEILKHFATKPFLSSSWRTREHKASYKAWGKSLLNEDIDSLTDKFTLEAVSTYKGDYWYISSPDTIYPNSKIISKPLTVLIGNNTASAAEDFLVVLDQLDIATKIGQTTYGSTGQPLFIQLPGGGSARICTKKDTYPDGKEFVGYGIKPDIEIKENINDLISGYDATLNFSIKYLMSK